MKKLISLLLIICIGVAAAGCGKSIQGESNTFSADENQKIDSAAEPAGAGDEQQEDMFNQEEGGQTGNIENSSNNTNVTAPELDKSLFSGKIKEIYYGQDGYLLVRSDKIYLYDITNGSIKSSIDNNSFSDDDIKICAYTDGYAVIGMTSQGSDAVTFGESAASEWVCILYDQNLKEKNRISISEKTGDSFIISTSAVTMAKDGGSMAWAALDGIYFYDIQKDSTTKILQFPSENSLTLLDISYLSFAENNKKLAFLGSGFPHSAGTGDNSISIYGTINIDGSNLVNGSNQSYTADDMIAYDHFMYLPQNFKKADGTLLSVDLTDQTEKIYSFQESSEGKDGIYGSQKGKYFATAILGNNLTVRIYDKESGSVVKEETISGLNEIYYYRIPQVVMLDDLRTCIVLLGRNLQEVDTEVTTIHF